jgi:hypothetical protein
VIAYVDSSVYMISWHATRGRQAATRLSNTPTPRARRDRAQLPPDRLVAVPVAGLFGQVLPDALGRQAVHAFINILRGKPLRMLQPVRH